MLSRVVSCIALGFILAGFTVITTPCTVLAQDHNDAPALTGPATAEAELEQMGQQVGEATDKLVEQAITHPIADGEEGHGAEAGHHGPPVNPNPLEWRKDLAIWTGVVFLVVFGLLYKYAWGPITEGLDKREKGIADNIAAAHRSNEEAKAILDQYQARLDAAEGEVKAMIDKARSEAEGTGRKIVEAAQVAASAEQKRALAEIEQATTSALSELATRSADLAVSLAGKIVKSELKAADHAALVTEAVSNFGKPK